MNILCDVQFQDGSKTRLYIQKPAGALPDSLLSALEAIKVAEDRGKLRVK